MERMHFTAAMPLLAISTCTQTHMDSDHITGTWSGQVQVHREKNAHMILWCCYKVRENFNYYIKSRYRKKNLLKYNRPSDGIVMLDLEKVSKHLMTLARARTHLFYDAGSSESLYKLGRRGHGEISRYIHPPLLSTFLHQVKTRHTRPATHTHTLFW